MELGNNSKDSKATARRRRYCKCRQSFTSQEHCSATTRPSTPHRVQHRTRGRHCIAHQSAAAQHAIDDATNSSVAPFSMQRRARDGDERAAQGRVRGRRQRGRRPRGVLVDRGRGRHGEGDGVLQGKHEGGALGAVHQCGQAAGRGVAHGGRTACFRS